MKTTSKVTASQIADFNKMLKIYKDERTFLKRHLADPTLYDDLIELAIQSCGKKDHIRTMFCIGILVGIQYQSNTLEEE